MDFLRALILISGIAIAVLPVFGDRNARKSVLGLALMGLGLFNPGVEFVKDALGDHITAVQDAKILENRQLLDNADIRYQAVSEQLNEIHARGIERSAIQYNQIQELRAETQSEIAGVQERTEAEVATVRANLQAELNATNQRVSDIEQKINFSRLHQYSTQSTAQYTRVCFQSSRFKKCTLAAIRITAA